MVGRSCEERGFYAAPYVDFLRVGFLRDGQATSRVEIESRLGFGVETDAG
jgi:hypothetical protein